MVPVADLMCIQSPMLFAVTSARVYDMIEVGDVMTEPAITLRPFEKAIELVRLLETATSHGFPVVDHNGKFLGLVRRNQIVALLECGVFVDAPDNPEIFPSSSEGDTPSWTPKPGVHKSVCTCLFGSIYYSESPNLVLISILKPLMHWAYHIKDDRYHYIESRNFDEAESEDDYELEDDDFDLNDYLLSIRDVVGSFPGVEGSMRRSDRAISFAGDDSLPPLNSTPMQGIRKLSSRISMTRYSTRESDNSGTTTSTNVPTGFAKVGTGGSSGSNVVVKWLHPRHQDKYVNLSAVMNRGAFSCPHYFPLSKVYRLFTKLGLRWIVVTGGESGGNVVGIVTRRNLLPAHIRECTGLNL